MPQLMWTMLREEQGQDLTEYALIIAVVAVVAASFLGMCNDSIKGIVNTSTSQIKYGSDVAAGKQ